MERFIYTNSQKILKAGEKMNKMFFGSFRAVMLIVSLVSILIVLLGVYVYASHVNPGGGGGPQTDTGEDHELSVDLIPPEVYDYTSIYSMFEYKNAVKYNTATEGTLTLESSQSRYKNKMSVVLTVYNLEYLNKYDEIYEVWFVDLDTGFPHSLGLFTVDYDGYDRFSFKSESYADAYDMVVVTKEEYPDDDPRPNGEVVLVGYFDTTSLTKSSVSKGGISRYEYKQYGEEAENVYG